MNANELMLGDWVFHVRNRIVSGFEAGGPVRVLEIYEHGAQTDDGFVRHEDLEPIPLTPEILEKNFKEYLPGINLMYQLKGPYCAMNEDGQWVFGLVKVDRENSARYPLVKISYVHELQHTLRLCGIEKKITLN